MFKYPRKANFRVFHPREKISLRMAGNGAIAHPAAVEGKMVPVIILDTANRPDIDEFIRLHQFVGPGDVKVQWARKLDDPEIIQLVLKFLRPSELVAMIDFDLRKDEGVVVESILVARSLYIQAGRDGDRVLTTMDRSKIILEVPETGFDEAWDKIYVKHMADKMRANGLSRADAKRAARDFVDSQRATIRFFRVPTA